MTQADIDYYHASNSRPHSERDTAADEKREGGRRRPCTYAVAFAVVVSSVSSYAYNVPCQISPMYPLQRLPPQHHRHRHACTSPPTAITTTSGMRWKGREGMKGGAPAQLQPSPTARARRPHRPQSPRQPPAPNGCTCVRPPSTPLPLRV
ncbi:hypothetical protein B0H14DRAFT_542432 [Mycena olivaceomarginata]|nr:hypothetical protein B0H14DRAFT_542432 [Mycena olivaceomarginata]